MLVVFHGHTPLLHHGVFTNLRSQVVDLSRFSHRIYNRSVNALTSGFSLGVRE